MKYLLSLLIVIAFVANSQAQIQLPKEYTFVAGNILSECFFSDGRYNFVEYPYAHDGLTQQDVLTKTGYTFYKVKDNVYWSTGKNGQWYYYIVLIGTESLQLNSMYNDDKFKSLSKWMLQQALANYKNKKDLYFTNYQGIGIINFWSDANGILIDDGSKK